jgi:glycerol kinase
MKKKYILSLDAGTTSSRAVLFTHQGNMLGVAQKEFRQIFPKPGWVEHDPLEIWQTQRQVMLDVLAEHNVSPGEISAIGITNQRETTVVWNRHTGEVVHNAIVWQCRRTASFCETIKNTELEKEITEKTGLVVDAYFSGTKLNWILTHVPTARQLAEKGDLLFGTIDTWLLWNLTGGEKHATDYSNASRTMLFDIDQLAWSPRILKALGIPKSMLPEVLPSSGHFGLTQHSLFDGTRIPITGIAGDQQAALFGQACFQPGMAKNTYGTGCFLMLNTGEKRIRSSHGLLSTIAWNIGGKTTYALEGSIFSAGSSIQWLRDGIQIIKNTSDSESAALEVENTGGVYVVPAFTGLGAPYWDMYARAAILGLTRGSGRNHIIRATLESIAYQARDIFEAMMADAGLNLKQLQVDGGASANAFLMQFQSDMLQVTVSRPQVLETTALGAAALAGLETGFWKSTSEFAEHRLVDSTFTPSMPEEKAANLYKGWKKAVSRAQHWEDQSKGDPR